MNYNLDYLEQLEAESIFIIREVYEQFENPCLLFSGGKDSIVLIHLAQKAFYPNRIPFKILHVDTGYNFPEIIKFRDIMIKNHNLDLIVASVEKYINESNITGNNIDRNRLQIPVLLNAIHENNFDAAIGGGRRDEEKARAKERIFSHRNKYGQWNPENQRPELWNIYNGNKNKNEHFRIFPLSNWTELDVWQYISKDNIKIPNIYFSHKRKVIFYNGTYLAVSRYVDTKNHEIYEKNVRCRTVGDIVTTGLWESKAKSIEDIIMEVALSETGERGKRVDDKVSPTSMEDRKREGYF